MSASLWKLSLSLLQQLHGFVYSSHDRSQLAAHIYYKLTMETKREHDTRSLDRRRASSLRISYGDARAPDALDTFDHVLDVTAHHEALLAYYYLDGENKMKMTEIYDVTEADTDAVQSPAERLLNTQLEFDADWGEALLPHHEPEDYDLEAPEDDALAERNLFSDPESEWPLRTFAGSEADQPEVDQRT